MVKKIMLPLGLIGVITLLCIGIYYVNKPTLPLPTNTQTHITPTPITFPMRLSFEPATITRSNTKDYKIDSRIKLDVGPHDIRSVTLVLLCDPKRIKNLVITQEKDRYSALSYALTDFSVSINKNACEATLTFSIPDENPEQRGSGIIAKLSATVVGTTPTEITILPQSNGKTDTKNTEFQTERVNLEIL